MKKLIVFDMDGVIFKHTNFWHELHKVYGTEKEGFALTKRYVKSDYQKLVEEVIGRLWKGKAAKPYFDLIDSLEYVDGAKETLVELKKRGYLTAIITSGPSDLALRAKKDCYVDFIFANRLVIKDGFVEGNTDMKYWPIRHDTKNDPLMEICMLSKIPLADSIVVGHDDADIKMAKEAGLAIAFFPSSEEFTKHCEIVINEGEQDLRQIMKYL